MIQCCICRTISLIARLHSVVSAKFSHAMHENYARVLSKIAAFMLRVEPYSYFFPGLVGKTDNSASLGCVMICTPS